VIVPIRPVDREALSFAIEERISNVEKPAEPNRYASFIGKASEREPQARGRVLVGLDGHVPYESIRVEAPSNVGGSERPEIPVPGMELAEGPSDLRLELASEFLCSPLGPLHGRTEL
jgi:hypothetical protein